jgi:hypothetical protein
MERLSPRALVAAILALLLITVAAAAADGLPRWLEVITIDQLRGDAGFLAAEELAGRAVLSPGSRTAAAFIASRFQTLGLRPAGEGSRDWYQQVPLARYPVRSGICRVERKGSGGGSLEFDWGVDFRIRPMAARGTSGSGRVVFAGYGIHAPGRGHDDYADLEVKNRVVVVLADGPPDFSSRRHTSVRAKREAAWSRGAKAVVVLPRPGDGDAEARLHPGFWPDFLDHPGEPREKVDCPSILLTEGAARRFAELAGLDPGAEPKPRPLDGVRVSCSLKMDDLEEHTSRNVLGLVPGSHELHFREFVVVSAHYDHLGARGDQLFPGADDNASGVTALIAVARAVSALPPQQRPARSILFIAWAGEERGFLGSEHFIANPTVPRGQITAMINLDMVGRSRGDDPALADTALAIYSAQAPGLEFLLDEAAAAGGLDLRLCPRIEIGPSSDHTVFHQQGIPAVHLFSGLHDDYNRPGDTADKLDYGKLQRIAHTAAQLAFLVADEPEPPLFDETITGVQGRNDPF